MVQDMCFQKKFKCDIFQEEDFYGVDFYDFIDLQTENFLCEVLIV